MKSKRAEKRLLICAVSMFLILLPCIGQAEIPGKINYQGYLTSAAGVPVNATVAMVFSFYTVDTGGSLIWSETQNVTVNHGVYNVNLGDVTPITSLPFGLPYYLGIKVGADPEMTPRIPLTSVGYAFRAKTADYVYGSGTFSNTIISTVTTGTAPMQVSSTTNVANLNADMLDGQHAAAFAPASHAHDDRYYDKTYVNALESRIAALEAKLSGLTRSGNDFIITNANLYIRSGSGATDGAVNGKGNLIIGHNELRGSGDNRTGSHNLIIGTMHNYSSYGGIVAGFGNTISGTYSSVSGGSGNTASGDKSSVSGGSSNTASGYASSVSGGDSNTASAWSSSISGGQFNKAVGYLGSSVSGGQYNTASGLYSSVSGGRYNVASGDYSSVAGGGSDIGSTGNKAFGHYTAILGGYNNKAGDPALTDHTKGQNSTVSGGGSNTASGVLASVSGGQLNTASGWGSSVIGGESNTASGDGSSISGGYTNTASGPLSSGSGGESNTASGIKSSVSGGYAHNASGYTASVSGGFGNQASGDYSSVSGGDGNNANGTASSISGGAYHAVYGWADWAAGGLFQTQ